MNTSMHVCMPSIVSNMIIETRLFHYCLNMEKDKTK